MEDAIFVYFFYYSLVVYHTVLSLVRKHSTVWQQRPKIVCIVVLA